jgi:CRP-like cAMP-binding protein
MSQKSPFQIFENQPSRFVKKGEVLVKTGQKSNEGFYVVKGCLKSYIIDSKGKEHIYQFAPEDWLISDFEFVKNKGNSLLTIEAIEESEIKGINMDSFGTISSGDQKVIEEALNKLRNRVYALQMRVIQLLAYSAEERYQEFLKMYPNLSSRLPLKMIASYLGVTPESLSRVRKELVKGK